MKGGFDSDNENVNESGKESRINNHLAQTVFLQNRKLFANKKQIIFEKKEEEKDNLLDETLIKDLDN